MIEQQIAKLEAAADVQAGIFNAAQPHVKSLADYIAGLVNGAGLTGTFLPRNYYVQLQCREEDGVVTVVPILFRGNPNGSWVCLSAPPPLAPNADQVASFAADIAARLLNEIADHLADTSLVARSDLQVLRAADEGRYVLPPAFKFAVATIPAMQIEAFDSLADDPAGVYTEGQVDAGTFFAAVLDHNADNRRLATVYARGVEHVRYEHWTSTYDVRNDWTLHNPVSENTPGARAVTVIRWEN